MPDRSIRLRSAGPPARARAGVIAVAGGGRRATAERPAVGAQLRALRRENEALRERDRRWRALHDASVDGVMAFAAVRDADRRIADFEWLYANEAAARIVGRPADWFPGRRLLDEMPGNRVEGLFDAYIDVVERGETWTGESHYVHEGVDAWLRVVAARTGDGFSVTFADLSAQRRAEQAVRRSEDRLRIALEAVRAGVFDYAVDTGALEWTDGLYALLGLEPSDAPLTLDAWRARVHPDDLPRVEATLASALEHGTPYRAEYRIRRPDGTVAWVQGHGVLRRQPDGSRRLVGAMVDVDDRHRVEDARRASEERYRLAADAVRGVVYDCELSSGLVVRSQGLEALAGWRPDEADPDAAWWMGIVHPEDRQRVAASVAAELAGDASRFDLNYRIVRRDGRPCAVWDRVVVMRDEAGRATRIVGSVADVDALERVELALRESRERFVALAESVPMPIWTTDASGTVDYLNRRWTEYTGQDATVARGQGWADPVHPDDRALVVAAWTAAVGAGTPYVCDYRLRGADGVYRWFQSRATAQRGRDGAVERWFGACIDVHELRAVREALERTAERLRAATEAAGLGILELDVASAEVRLDARAAALWGRTDDRPADWSALVAAIHPGDRAAARAAIAAALDGGPGRVELEHRIVDAAGAERWVRTTGNVRRERGVAVAVVGTVQDIGPQKATEHALREVDRRKDRFLAILSHELRNPFAPIRNAARVLGMPTASDAQRGWARDVIQRQVAHVSLLLDDLLDLARIKQGKLVLRREAVALREVVDAAVEVARPLIASRGHALRVALPEPPPVLDADPLRLSQVLANLLTNAAKYTDPGGHLSLDARLADGALRIAVRDDGIGLDAASIGRIFEMFSQVEAARERADGGLGIGLALVRGLVELHGGTVSVRSAGPGAGSEFVVELPAAAVIGRAAGAGEAAAAPPA